MHHHSLHSAASMHIVWRLRCFHIISYNSYGSQKIYLLVPTKRKDDCRQTIIFFQLRRQDSNMRPPGYEPGELPTAPLRDFSFADAKLLLFFDSTKFLTLFFSKNCFQNPLIVEKAIEKSKIYKKMSILCRLSVSGGFALACSFTTTIHIPVKTFFPKINNQMPLLRLFCIIFAKSNRQITNHLNIYESYSNF